jgi:hypothetical protein
MNKIQSKSASVADIPARLQLLDENQVVAMGVCSSVHTLRSWRHEGRGPKFIKVEGTLVRYRLSDIEAFLNSLPGGGAGVKVSA